MITPLSLVYLAANANAFMKIKKGWYLEFELACTWKSAIISAVIHQILFASWIVLNIPIVMNTKRAEAGPHEFLSPGNLILLTLSILMAFTTLIIPAVLTVFVSNFIVPGFNVSGSVLRCSFRYLIFSLGSAVLVLLISNPIGWILLWGYLSGKSRYRY